MVRAPPSGIRQATPRSNRGQLFQDALIYLRQIKRRYAHSPDTYNRFLRCLLDFKNGALDTPGVIARVCYLFRTNPSLIAPMNSFLPTGYHIRVDGSRVFLSDPTGQEQLIVEDREESEVEDTAHPSTAAGNIVRSVTFLNKVRTRFLDRPEVYEQFLNVLGRLGSADKDAEENTRERGRRARATLEELFGNEHDLIAELRTFLP